MLKNYKLWMTALILACSGLLGYALSPLLSTNSVGDVDPQTTGYEGAELPTAPDMSGTVVNVTAANAQYTLDGAYGSIDGKTINFTENISTTLIIGRPTKYAGSNTEYRHGSFDNDAMSYADYIAYKSQSGYVEYSYYNRAVSNVTFTANEGVTVAGFTAAGGAHVYGKTAAPIYDYVLDNGTWCYDTNYGYFLYTNLSNIKFQGLTITGKNVFDTSSELTVYDGFTFDGCTFNINNTASGNQAIHYYDENNNGNVRNLVVNNCTFNSCYQGVYIQNAKGLTVTNSTFNTTGHNAIAMQGGTAAAPVDLGTIVITGNTIEKCGNRAIRFGHVGANTKITIQNNNAYYGDSKTATCSEESMKAESLADGITYDISGNEWNNYQPAYNEPLQEKATAVAKIGDTSYETLDAAVAAVKSGETIEIIADVVNYTGSLSKSFAYTITAAEGVSASFGNTSATLSYQFDNGYVTFNNVTLITNSGNYHYTRNVTCNNCTLIGDFCLSGNTIFNGCTFYAPGDTRNDVSKGMDIDYSAWCYGDNAKFTNCHFYGNGKLMHVYCESNTDTYNVSFDKCDFHSTASSKAAINVKETCPNNGNMLKYNVTITDCTTDGSFPAATEFDATANKYIISSLVQVDERNEAASASETGIKVTLDGTVVYPVADAVAKIGETTYATIDAAVAAATEGQTIEVLKAGTYTLPNLPLNVTIKGDVDGVVFEHTAAGSICSVPNGSTFNNVTFNLAKVNYHGFQHAGTINMENCTVNGLLFSYGKMNFTSCTFNAPGTPNTKYADSGVDYCMWNYGTGDTYTNCTFNAAGKFLNVYCEGNTDTYNVTVDGCKFINTADAYKAALNVKETCGSTMLKYNVVIKNSTTEGNFPDAATYDKTKTLYVIDPLVQVDDRNTSATETGLKVTLNDVVVYPVAADPVAKIGDVEYTDLAVAIAAAIANNNGVPVDIIKDITYADGATWTPVPYVIGTLTINGNGHTITNLPDMLISKQGSGGHFLTVKDVTFESPKASSSSDYCAVICGYADCMNLAYFENVNINNAKVSSGKYAGAFIGYAAGYNNTGDGPVYQEITFKNCSVTNSTITGEGSTGALIGHAAGNTWASITVEGTKVTGNTVTSTGSDTNKAGALFGTVGAAGITTDIPKAGIWVEATVTGNTVTSNGTTITTIYGRQGTSTGTLRLNPGGDYENVPIAESDASWASCIDGYGIKTLESKHYTVAAVDYIAQIGTKKYETIQAAFEACAENATEATTVTLLKDVEAGESFGFPDSWAGKGKNIILDLGGHTYTFRDPGMGSTGTASQAMHLASGNTLTVKNGKLALNSESTTIKRMIQNYCDLTLEDVIVDTQNNLPTGFSSYNNSFCRGTVTLKGNTQFLASSASAISFDIDGSYCQYKCDVALVIDESFTGSIGGKVEYVKSTTDGQTSTLTDNAKYYKASVVANATTSYPYTTLAGAVDAASAGQTVQLLADNELTATVANSKNLTLDMNSFNINASSKRALWQQEGTLTITGKGTISTTTTGEITDNNGSHTDAAGFVSSSSVIRVGDNAGTAAGIVVGADVTVTTDFCYGITYFGTDNQTVEINGTVKGGYASGLSGNGSANFGKSTVTINEGATVTSDYNSAIYHPEDGALTVKGGTITGPVGIQMCSGTATISGGTITGTSADKRSEAGNDGSLIDGAAVSIVKRDGYKNTPSVTITGGKFGSSTKAILDYNWANAEATEWSADENPASVSGGVFTQKVQSECLAAGYYSTSNTDAETKAAYPYTVAAKDVKGTIYAGNTTAQTEKTLTDFEAVRKDYPNAIMIVESKYEEQVLEETNVVVEYAAGAHGNKYYECSNFILTDNNTDNCSFYSPVSFTAVAGSYERALGYDYNTCCVPFALKASDISATAQLLTFARYQDGGFVYFYNNAEIPAGVPCFIYDNAPEKIQKTFDNTLIVGTPQNSGNLKGTFTETNSFSNYFGFVGETNDLAQVGNVTIYPFRSTLDLSGDITIGTSGASAAPRLKLVIDKGTVTGIDDVNKNAEAPKGIYTLSGIKLNEITEPGIYIVDGKKVVVK